MHTPLFLRRLFFEAGLQDPLMEIRARCVQIGAICINTYIGQANEEDLDPEVEKALTRSIDDFMQVMDGTSEEERQLIFGNSDINKVRVQFLGCVHQIAIGEPIHKAPKEIQSVAQEAMAFYQSCARETFEEITNPQKGKSRFWRLFGPKELG